MEVVSLGSYSHLKKNQETINVDGHHIILAGCRFSAGRSHSAVKDPTSVVDDSKDSNDNNTETALSQSSSSHSAHVTNHVLSKRWNIYPFSLLTKHRSSAPPPHLDIKQSISTTHAAENSMGIVAMTPNVNVTGVLSGHNTGQETQTSLMPLTMADLEMFLEDGGYVKQSDLINIDGRIKSTKSSSKFSFSPATKTTTLVASAKNAKKRTVGGLAFPQPSILSNRELHIGATIAASFYAAALASSVSSNLWLVGGVLGASYGYSIPTIHYSAYKPKEKSSSESIPSSFPIRAVLWSGYHLARISLLAWDFINGFWFMYRTGQLSYEYYKRYSALDSKFKIQKKVDAWNAKFIEGKENFDRWERENEIGRKVLATLRTAWMVEEKSLKKTKKGKRKQSKYRVVRLLDHLRVNAKNLFQFLLRVLTGGSIAWEEFFYGIRSAAPNNNEDSSILGLKTPPRWGSILIALTFVNIFGTVFSVAPALINLLAISVGYIFPTWSPNLTHWIVSSINSTRERGHQILNGVVVDNSNNKKTQNTKGMSGSRLSQRYNFFVRMDGSKRWYRTATPHNFFGMGVSPMTDDNNEDSGQKRRK